MKKHVLKMTLCMTALFACVGFWCFLSAGTNAYQDVPDDLPTGDDVLIDETNFPDENFRAVITTFDSNHDGILSSYEAGQIRGLDVKGQSISSLKGIEFLHNLDKLDCSDNQLTELVYNKDEGSFTLDCSNNQLTRLEVSAWELKVDCSNNQLTELSAVADGADEEENARLASSLDCSNNKLTKLHTNIFKVDCSHNLLTELLTSSQVLNCSDNKLESLNLKSCKNLSVLDCSENDLSELDLCDVPLRVLDCGKNKLTKIVINENTQLKKLICNDNQLTELDISSSNLRYLNCQGNQIDSLNIDSCSDKMWYYVGTNGMTLSEDGTYYYCNDDLGQEVLAYDADVQFAGTYSPDNPIPVSSRPESNIPVDSEHFPDGIFRWFISTYIDLDADGILSDDERDTPRNWSFSGEWGVVSGIESLQGIRYFPWLETLSFFNYEEWSRRNKITELDLSGFVYLTSLSCSDNLNPALKLNLKGCSNLVQLSCSGKRMEELDLSTCNKLEKLYCGYVKELNLSGCNKLKVAEFDGGMKKLNLEGCSLLTYVTCTGIQELNVRGCTSLITLNCSDGKLSSLDLSQCPALLRLYCRNNALMSLDISQCTKLTTLYCENNILEELDLSAVHLSLLGCSDNRISELNLDTCSPSLWDTVMSEGGMQCDGKRYYCIPEWMDTGDGIFNCDVSVNFTGEISPIDFMDPKPTPTQGPTPTPKEPTQGPTVTPTPTKAPVKDPTFEDFVERLYTVALGRASEPEGKAFWIKQVVEEGKTGADCARFFLLDADEFMKRGLSVEDFVETLYATFFDRESDAAGKKGWVDAIKSGKKTRAEVVNDFIESTEWCNVCATYGVKSGAKWHKATFASKNAKDFATRLYTCCLGRNPEEGGLKYWSLALTNLEQTGCSAAKLFFTSDEFVGFKLKDEEYIRRLYTTFMGREPAASEVSYWMGEIKKGTQTKYSVMQFFGQSPEFTGICKKYGIDRGEI